MGSNGHGLQIHEGVEGDSSGLGSVEGGPHGFNLPLNESI